MKSFLKYIMPVFGAACLAFSCDKPEEKTEPAAAILEIADFPECAEFHYGEVKTFKVTAENVASIDTEYPAGWDAYCDESDLFIQAPEMDDETAEMNGTVKVLYCGTSGEEYVLDLEVACIEQGVERPAVSFELEYSDVTAASVHLKVVPDNKEALYYYDICTEDDYDRYDGDVKAIVNLAIEKMHAQQPQIPLDEFLSVVLDKGDSEDDLSPIPSDTKMYFYAVAVGLDGKAYGEPALESFRTLPAGKPEECTFEFECTEIKGTSAVTTTIPSDASVRYWMSIEEVRNWPGDEAIGISVQNYLERYAADNGMSLEDVVAKVTLQGTFEDVWRDLSPNTVHYVYAYAMDEGGNKVGPLFKDKFTTRESDVSDAVVNLVYRYFDGTELSGSDPVKYPAEKYAGKVLVQVKATPDMGCADWYVALGPEAYMDSVTYPDESTISAMMRIGNASKELQQFIVPSYSKCSLLSFGIDIYGVIGVLNRELLELTEEGASPIEEVAPIPTSEVLDMQPGIYRMLSRRIGRE